MFFIFSKKDKSSYSKKHFVVCLLTRKSVKNVITGERSIYYFSLRVVSQLLVNNLEVGQIF